MKKLTYHHGKTLLVPLVILAVFTLILVSCSSTGTTAPSQTSLSTPPVTSTAPATSVSKPPASPTNVSPSPISGSSSKYGGTLRWIAGIGPGTPIGVPWEASGGAAFTMQLSLQGLVKELLGGSIAPNLASSYDVNNDPANPSITFHLQKGVKFSDGTDFNAQAVKWNLEQEMSPASTNVGSTTQWKSIDVIDDYTVRISLKTWQNTLTAGVGQLTYISPTAYQKNGESWMQWNMVGTGPFVQSNFQRDVSLTTVKNPNYWEQGKPYVDGVQILYVADMMTSEALMKAAGAEVLDCQGDGRIATEMQAAGFNILAQPAGAISCLAPDSLDADSPWSNLKVRQAAEYAIDKEALAKTFGYGYGQGAYQIINSSSLAYDSNLAPRKYDVAKAKQLLSEAGYPDGFKTTIIVAPFGLNRDMIVAIQSYLAKVGIQCTLQFPEAAQAMAYLTSTSPHNALIFNPIMQFANPNRIFSFYLTEPKAAWYQSVKHPDGWADVLNASLTAPKVDSALAQKCADALYNDATFLPLVSSAAPFALSPAVQDSGIGTMGSLTYWQPANVWFGK
jgi:peptide/nickel transport system substrate-binding protein